MSAMKACFQIAECSFFYAKINGKAGLAISLFFPIGFPVYLLATYQRKLLRHDIKMVQKTSYELIDIIEKLPVSL